MAVKWLPKEKTRLDLNGTSSYPGQDLNAILTPFFPAALKSNAKFSQLHLLSSVQSLSCVRLFATPWTATYQASLSIANSQSLPKLMSIELVMPSNHIILCRPLQIFPSIRAFSKESALHIRWPKYWSFSFNISPSHEHPLGWTCWISLQSKGLSRVFSNTTVQKHQFFCAQLSL